MDDDMSLYIQDEMDTDDRKSRSTKLAQTALSDKTIEYRVKSQKPDGTWYLDKQVFEPPFWGRLWVTAKKTKKRWPLL